MPKESTTTRPLTVAFHTLGCRVNQYETASMQQLFREAGYREVAWGEVADVYVVNTCTVTALADRKSRQFLRRAKKQNPEALVCATGCYVQTDPEALAGLPEVDLLLGNDEKYSIVQAVNKGRNRKAPVPETSASASYESMDFQESGVVPAAAEKTRAHIKIQDGCDRGCAYCIIPTARGPVRSRERDRILEEAEALLARGYRELVLTGINTALYEDLPGLLADLDGMPGTFRVRLSSLEPTVVDVPLVERILQSQRLCHHLHLSLQSGSDRILAAMRRPYTGAEYLAIVRVLRDVDPHFNVTTDMIVGFPGEKEEDHRDSMALAEQVGFGKIHVFPYSKRPGTAAATMPEQVPATIKKERAAELQALGEGLATDYHSSLIGTRQRILLEEQREGYWTGYTDGYVEAQLVSSESPCRISTASSGQFWEGVVESAGPQGIQLI